MKKFMWKMEYSVVTLILFCVVLFLIPTSFSSKEAVFISNWNFQYNKVEYMFSAMSAHADSELEESLKNATSNDLKEKYMIALVKPYLRLQDPDQKKKRHYTQHYMNGKVVNKKDFYYFDNLYKSEDGIIYGIKDIKDKDEYSPAFIMMIDMNGSKRPNTWGKDIFGLNIYKSGQVSALGKDMKIDALRKDCSSSGTGIACSHFYRIGGEFNE